jgi:2-polyprenyl-3-methyl-5-hydroxy-6-metoxy-1,4-benzoquinol methylase
LGCGGSAPLDSAHAQFDLLVSAGFLEHFQDPVPILSRWADVLKPTGFVVSAIPNLHSINARIF